VGGGELIARRSIYGLGAHWTSANPDIVISHLRLTRMRRGVHRNVLALDCMHASERTSERATTVVKASAAPGPIAVSSRTAIFSTN
jgi:hypothetical protein